MGLPVIATNWSGTTEFMNQANSYPLKISGLVEIEDGPFQGHKWAEPSVDHLRQLMRHVQANREEAKAKGKVARKDMLEKYCMKCLNAQVGRRLRQIEKEVELLKRPESSVVTSSSSSSNRRSKGGENDGTNGKEEL